MNYLNCRNFLLNLHIFVWMYRRKMTFYIIVKLKCVHSTENSIAAAYSTVLFCFVLFCSTHHNHDEFSPSFFSDLINSFEWTNHNACHLAHEISIAIFLFSIAFVSLLFLCIFFARLLDILPHSCKINYTPNFDRVFMSRFLSIFLSFFIFTY